jgi:hypothetical protein
VRAAVMNWLTLLGFPCAPAKTVFILVLRMDKLTRAAVGPLLIDGRGSRTGRSVRPEWNYEQVN